jgi:hypothetical protein
MCSTLNKSIELIKEKFINFTKGINNTITCNSKIDKTIIYILWINVHEKDIILPFNGITCNQLNNSINIFDILNY